MTAISPCFRFADANRPNVDSTDESSWVLGAGEAAAPLRPLAVMRQRYIYVFQRIAFGTPTLYAEYYADQTGSLAFCDGALRSQFERDDPAVEFDSMGTTDVSVPDNVNGRPADYFFFASRLRLTSSALLYLTDNKPDCVPYLNVADGKACVIDDTGSNYVPVIDPLFVARQLNLHYLEACNAVLVTSATYPAESDTLQERVQQRSHTMMVAKLLKQVLDGPDGSRVAYCFSDGSGANVSAFIDAQEAEVQSLILERDRRGALLTRFLNSDLLKFTQLLYFGESLLDHHHFLNGLAPATCGLNECPNGRARLGDWLRNPPQWVSQYVLPSSELSEGHFQVGRKSAAALAQFWAEFAPALATANPQRMPEILGRGIQYVTRQVVITARKEVSYVTLRYTLESVPMASDEYYSLNATPGLRDKLANWAVDTKALNDVLESVNKIFDCVNLILAAKGFLDAKDGKLLKGAILLGAGLDTVSAFKALTKLRSKTLRGVGALSAAIDVAMAAKDGYDAYQKADTSALIGYASVGFGSTLIFIGWTSAVAGVGTSATVVGLPAGLVMAIGGGILVASGYIVAAFTADSEMETYIKHCCFGSAYGTGNAKPKWAGGTFASWNDGLEGTTRQVKALFNVLSAFTVEAQPAKSHLAADAAIRLSPGLIQDKSVLHVEYTATWVDSTRPDVVTDKQNGYCQVFLSSQGQPGRAAFTDTSGVFEEIEPSTTVAENGRTTVDVYFQCKRPFNALPPPVELFTFTLYMRLDINGDGTAANKGADAKVLVPSGPDGGMRLAFLAVQSRIVNSSRAASLSDSDVIADSAH